MTKIIKLKVKNVKRIREIEIHADPVINELAGENEAGKTSILDAIRWAFAGKAAIKASMPVRKGEESASIIVETDDYIIVRDFSNGGDKTSLRISAKDGSKMLQRDLNEIWNDFTFDPLAFNSLKPTDQINILMDLAGSEFVQGLREIDNEISRLYEDRLLAGRELRNCGDIETVDKVLPVDVAELTRELSETQRKNNEIDDARRTYLKMEEQLSKLKSDYANIAIAIDKLEKAMTDFSYPDERIPEEPIIERLGNAQGINVKAAAYNQYLSDVKKKADLKKMHDDLQCLMDATREKRKVFVSSAVLPIDGVDFTENGLIVDGIPFNQLSSGRKIKISAAIGMANAPELRVMFVQNGSLLDARSFEILRQEAEKNNYQLWVETVGRGHSEESILIEDGVVVDTTTIFSRKVENDES